MGRRALPLLGLGFVFYIANLASLSFAKEADAQNSEAVFTRLLQVILNRQPSSDSGEPQVGTQCQASLWSSGLYNLSRNGIERSFQVYVPSSYDSSIPSPLIVAFHGWGGNENEFLKNQTVKTELDARGYILVAPVGLGSEEMGRHYSSWSFSGSTSGLDGDGVNVEVSGDSEAICDDARTPDYTYGSCAGVAENGCSWTQCSDNDVNFAVALADKTQENLCIDSTRIFAVGGSNGGMFIWDLGWNQASSDTFRAIAPILGLPHRGYLSAPINPEGMPVLLITGTSDRTVPPGEWDDSSYTTTSDGDVYYYTGASAITEIWAEAMGCDTSTSATPIDVGLTNIDCRGWDYCSGNNRWPPVMDCRAEMGHTYGLSWSWPLILDFFDQYR